MPRSRLIFPALSNRFVLGLVGFAEEHVLPDVVFETQYHSFQGSRKAEDPTGATIKGDKKLSTLGGKARGNEGYGALDKNDGERGIKRLSKLKKSMSSPKMFASKLSRQPSKNLGPTLEANLKAKAFNASQDVRARLRLRDG